MDKPFILLKKIMTIRISTFYLLFELKISIFLIEIVALNLITLL